MLPKWPTCRASDNSRGKKSNFAEKTADFAGISQEFWEQISPKNKEERFQKINVLEGCQIQGKKENTKVHSTQF